VVSKVSYLEKQLESASGGAGEDAGDLRKEVARLSQLEDKYNEMSGSFKVLQISKEKDELVLSQKIQHLESSIEASRHQLEEERSKSKMQEDAIRAQLDRQYETVLTTLKEQLQIREKEINFMSTSRTSQQETHRREQRLMSSVLHNIGLRYHQGKARCDQLEAELQAIKAKIASRRQLRTETLRSSQLSSLQSSSPG